MAINNPKYLIVHHIGGIESDRFSDTSNQTFEDVNEYHREKWNFISSLGYYIGYHYFIDKNGIIKQGRADTDEGAHTIGKNLESIGICLAGNFDLTVPTYQQITALSSLLLRLKVKYNIKLENIVPHRKFAEKSCYGNNLSDDWAKQLLQPSDKPIESCIADQKIIDEQSNIINNFKVFISNLFKKI